MFFVMLYICYLVIICRTKYVAIFLATITAARRVNRITSCLLYAKQFLIVSVKLPCTKTTALQYIYDPRGLEKEQLSLQHLHNYHQPRSVFIAFVSTVFFTTSRPVFTLNNNNSSRVNNRLVVQCFAFTRPSNLACWREMSELELFDFLYVMVLERSLEGYDPEQQFYDWVNEISTLIT